MIQAKFVGDEQCLNDVRHSPETEGNVRSTLVLCKKYSQLADETCLNLKCIYIRTNGFFGYSKKIA